MRESQVERKFKENVKFECGEAYKFVSPGRRGVPDRLVLYPVPLAMQKLVAHYIQFVELKAPGKKPNARQKREHKALRELGFTVKVIDK